MRWFAGFLAGVLFGLCQAMSGMTNPLKVQDFLDITGHWYPSLARVMGGAVVTTWVGYRLARRRGKPWLADTFHWPDQVVIDRPLLLGSALFGIGWGLAGFCPGPAIVSAGAGQPKAIVFVLAMLAGMWLFEIAEGRMRRNPNQQAGAL